MISATGKVISTQNGVLEVSCQQKSSCQACAARTQCGTGLVHSALPSRTFIIQLDSELDLPLGSSVSIGFPDSLFLRFASAVYLLPLLFLILGALLGDKSGALLGFSGAASEGLAIGMAFSLMGLGFICAKALLKRLEKRHLVKPVLL